MTVLGFLLLVCNFLISSFFRLVQICPLAHSLYPLCRFFPKLESQFISQLAQGPPNWIYFIFAFNIWIYQILDNLDGRQARRTGSSSALGELFDHGCDSLFVMLTALALFEALGLDLKACFFLVIMSNFVFYLAHWEEYNTNQLILGTWDNPTELQLSIIGIFIVTAFLGKNIWGTVIFDVSNFSTFQDIGPIRLNDLISFFLGFIAIIAIISSIQRTWKKAENKIKTIIMLIPYTIHITIMIIWIHWSPYKILHTQTWTLYCIEGLITSYMCNHLMLSRICKLKYTIFEVTAWIPIAAVINVGPWFTAPPIREEIMMPIILLITIILYFHGVLSVIIQLRDYLEISVFKIKQKTEVMNKTKKE